MQASLPQTSAAPPDAETVRLRDLVGSLERQNLALKHANALIRTELEQKTTESQKETVSLGHAPDIALIEALTTQLDDSRAALARAESQVTQLHSKIASLEATATQSKSTAQVPDQSHQVAELEAALAESQSREYLVSDQLSRATTKMLELEDQVKEFLSEAGSFKHQQHERDAELARLRDENGALSLQITELNADVQSAQGDAQSLRAQLADSVKQVCCFIVFFSPSRLPLPRPIVTLSPLYSNASRSSKPRSRPVKSQSKIFKSSSQLKLRPKRSFRRP